MTTDYYVPGWYEICCALPPMRHIPVLSLHMVATPVHTCTELSKVIMLQTTKCGDEVEHGKPAPDCFHAAAAKIGVAHKDCLVIEDAPTGVQAATAAGMRVVTVPSLTDKEAYPKADPETEAGMLEGSCQVHIQHAVAVLHVCIALSYIWAAPSLHSVQGKALPALST